MKVLQICNKPPYPPVDGGTMAMNSITQGLLSAGCKVKVYAVCSDKHPVKEHAIDESYREKTQFEAEYIDLNPHILNAGVAMFCGESYHVQRYISSGFKSHLIEILKKEEFDIVLVESIFITPYVETIRKYSQAKIILRAHNVEHDIWKQLAQSTRDPMRRWYLKHLSLTLAAYEREHANDYDGIACITEKDASFFKEAGYRKTLTAIPFAVEPEPLDNIEAESNSLFHIGSMDWMPNVESIEWLLSDIWPEIHKEVPQVKMYIAGRNTPDRLMNYKAEGVTMVGEVPDAMYFIGSKQINIVPLRSGSGIRVKIIEAMSAGKTVISTTLGAQGIEYTDGKNILIANTPKEFAQQVKRCVDDPEYCSKIGHEAYNLIATRYANKQVTQELVEYMEKILNN